MEVAAFGEGVWRRGLESIIGASGELRYLRLRVPGLIHWRQAAIHTHSTAILPHLLVTARAHIGRALAVAVPRVFVELAATLVALELDQM